MTCHDARELCSALLDDALASEERAALDVHLAQCADCTRELSRLRQTVSMLRAAPPVRAPAGFVDRVLAVARPTPWYRRLARRLFRPLAVKLPMEAAALLLVGVAAVYVFQHTPELQQAARQEAPARPAAPAPPRPEVAAPKPAPAGPEAPGRPGTGPLHDDARRKAASATQSVAPAVPPSSAPSAKDAPPPQPAARAAERDAASTGAAVAKKPAAETQAERSADVARSEAQNEQARFRKGALQTEAPKTEAPPTQAEAESKRMPAPPPVGMKSVPAEEGRQGLMREQRQSAAPAPAPSSPAASPRADGLSRLAAKQDQGAAEKTLADLIGRLGAVEISRRVEAGVTVVEVAVPREAHAEFAREVRRIGRWQIDRETDTAARVLVTLRLSD